MGACPSNCPYVTSNCVCPKPAACPGSPGCNTGCPVAAKNQACGRSAPKAGYQQRILDQRSLHVRLQAPAHRLPAVQVQHGSQVQPALVGGDVRGVAALHHVGRCRREAVLHQVRGHWQAVCAVGGYHELSPALAPDTVALHQSAHPLLAHAQAAGQQFAVHARPAVLSAQLLVDGSDVDQQGVVACRPRGPCSVRRVQASHRKYPLALTCITSHISVIGQRPFIEKIQTYLAARLAQNIPRLFFAMSRSIISRATCALKRAISSFSGVIVGVVALPSDVIANWPYASARTQFVRLALGMPSVAATTDAARPAMNCAQPPALTPACTSLSFASRSIHAPVPALSVWLCTPGFGGNLTARTRWMTTPSCVKSGRSDAIARLNRTCGAIVPDSPGGTPCRNLSRYSKSMPRSRNKL